MRNFTSILIVIFLLGMGASGLVGVGFRSEQRKGEGIAAPIRDDVPVDAVRSFWWLSLRESLGSKEMIGAPPKSFFDKRCSKGVPGVAVAAEVQDNWIRKSVGKLSSRIARHQIAGESIRMLSESGDEAVVTVSYLDPLEPESAAVSVYVFLHRKQGKWKLFLTLRDAVSRNTSYAGLRCTESEIDRTQR